MQRLHSSNAHLSNHLLYFFHVALARSLSFGTYNSMGKWKCYFLRLSGDIFLNGDFKDTLKLYHNPNNQFSMYANISSKYIPLY